MEVAFILTSLAGLVLAFSLAWHQERRLRSQLIRPRPAGGVPAGPGERTSHAAHP